MTILQFILVCWIIFMLSWILSAGSVKPIEKTSGWLSGNWYTLLFLLGFAFLMGIRPLGRLGIAVGPMGFSILPHSRLLNILTIVLLVGGLVIAIVARRTLASNWSGQVAIKQGHELVTTGLYSCVRNPIYTGILLMALGTALSLDTLSAGIGFLVITLAAYLKLSDEERILARHFGTEYSSYKQRTKALIPFLW